MHPSPTVAHVGRILVAAALAVPAVALTGGPATAAVSETARRTASFNGPVHVVEYAGPVMYVGGDFTRATNTDGTTVRRRNVAAIDVRSGRLLRWNPRANGTVQSLDLARGRVYLGGEFTRMGGARRARLAAVSKDGRGALVRAFRHRANSGVNALTVRYGRIYVGGSFTKVDGRTRRHLAAFNLRTGALDRRWRPSTDGSVLALAARSRRVYVAGLFPRLNDRAAHGYLGAVGISRGRIARSFNPVARYPFQDIALTRRAVYAAGDGPGGHLHKFSVRGANRWTRATNGGVQAVEVLGRRVYAGGHFTELCDTARVRGRGECSDGSVKRRKVFAVGKDGRRLGWSPEANSTVGVRTIAVHRRRNLVTIGGDFTQLGVPDNPTDWAHIAQFR